VCCSRLWGCTTAEQLDEAYAAEVAASYASMLAEAQHPDEAAQQAAQQQCQHYQQQLSKTAAWQIMMQVSAGAVQCGSMRLDLCPYGCTGCISDSCVSDASFDVGCAASLSSYAASLSQGACGTLMLYCQSKQRVLLVSSACVACSTPLPHDLPCCPKVSVAHSCCTVSLFRGSCLSLLHVLRSLLEFLPHNLPL
jgi:hypothetical protein